MKSETYSNNTFFKKTKGQMWIPISLAIGFFFAFPVAELIKLGNWVAYGYTAEEMARSYENLWVSGLLGTGAIVSFIAAFINGINGFWYLYSSSKVDFYHCLPVKRSRMFWEKTVSGLLYFLIPYIGMEFLAVCIGAMRGYFSLFLMKMALKMLLAHTVMYLMGYFCVALAISLTGNLLMGALMTGVIFLDAPIFGFLRTVAKEEFFKTYSAWGSVRGAGSAAEYYFSPFTLGNIFTDAYANGKGYWLNLLLMLVFAGIAAVAAYFAYTRRPMEKAGKSMVYKFVGVLVEFMIVIPSGLLFGLILREFTKGDSRELWWFLGLVLGTILTHGMLQVLYHLDFRKFFSARIQFLLAAGCVAVCALTLQFDLLGYDSYIPKYENLKNIEIDWSNLSGRERNNKKITEKNGKYLIDDFRCELGKNREAYEALKAVLERQKEIPETSQNTVLCLAYTNKFGIRAARTYYAEAEEIREILRTCYEIGNLKADKYSYLQISSDYLTGTSAVFANGANYDIFQGEAAKQDALLEALRMDVEDADTETLLGVPVACLEFAYTIPLTGGQTADRWGYSYVFPEYQRTLAILRETGYPLSVEEMEIESAKYGTHIYNENGYFMRAEDGLVADEAQLKELKSAMISYALSPEWVGIDRRVDVTVTVKGNTEWDIEMQFLKDKIPAFAEKEITEILKREGRKQEAIQPEAAMAEEKWGYID